MTSQVQSDGTLVPFTIPPKQVLIVTSGRITVNATNSNAPIFLSFTVGGHLFTGHNVVTDALGNADVTFSIPNGFAVSSGNTICLSVGAASTANGELHGFLAPDK